MEFSTSLACRWRVIKSWCTREGEEIRDLTMSASQILSRRSDADAPMLDVLGIRLFLVTYRYYLDTMWV